MSTGPVPERIGLAVLPTPLVKAPRLRAALGIPGRLLVKRDDLTGFAVAGNKARPLEFLAAEAVAHGADTLVTGGTPGSNFCQAAAATAARIGLKCELVYAGHHSRAHGGDGGENSNSRAARRWGANIRWTEDDDRSSVDSALQSVADRLRADGGRPYVMPRGGATPLGSVGFFRAAEELADQLDGPALIVIATGSGGTLAGLLAGAIAVAAPWTVVGASVSRPPEHVTARVLDLAAGCAERMGTRAPVGSELWIHDARGPGHGKPSAEGMRAAEIALNAEGMILDPVYTAKTVGALPEICRHHAGSDMTTVFWHTGGLLDAVDEWKSS